MEYFWGANNESLRMKETVPLTVHYRQGGPAAVGGSRGGWAARGPASLQGCKHGRSTAAAAANLRPAGGLALPSHQPSGLPYDRSLNHRH